MPLPDNILSDMLDKMIEVVEDAHKALDGYMHINELRRRSLILSGLEHEMIDGFTKDMNIKNCVKFREYVENAGVSSYVE